MKQGMFKTLSVTAALALAGAVWAGGVWVSDSGHEHRAGDRDIFVEQGSTAFDLSGLADGETRVFGSGDKQITATRKGDVIELSSDDPDGGRGLSLTCNVGHDSCRIVTFDEDSGKVAISIEKTRECVNGAGDCDDHAFGHADDAHVIIKSIIDCEDGEKNCRANIMKLLAGGGPHDHEGFIEISGDDGQAHDIRIMPMRLHAGGAFFHGEGTTAFDVADLLDGETRIFGFGDKQVTAVREGDDVRITRAATEDRDETTLTCRIGTDTCRILTFDDDPDKVAVMVRKRSHCVDGDCDAGFFQMGLDGPGDGSAHFIEFHSDSNVFFGDDDVSQREVRIKVIQEDD